MQRGESLPQVVNLMVVSQEQSTLQNPKLCDSRKQSIIFKDMANAYLFRNMDDMLLSCFTLRGLVG